ncbi:MAG: hypothetical protein KDB22_12905 [Planctomycetales bacterium]|nr:hypothetical protein [Planctomycetales bacterium]
MRIVIPTQRSELNAESRILAKRATWCGVVIALVSILTVLNFLPPVDVSYSVRSKILLSPSRLSQLNAALERSNEDDSSTVRLISVAVLDSSKEHAAEYLSTVGAPVVSSEAGLVLVEARTRWVSGYSERAHRIWFDKTTRPLALDSIGEELADKCRLARFQAQTLQHYIDREEFIGDPQSVEMPSVFSLASATIEESSPADSQVNCGSSNETVVILKNQLVAAEKAMRQAESALKEHQAESAGPLEFAMSPQLSPRTSRLPFWMAASILIVGVSCGASAGWFQLRMQSGGTYDPTIVATELALDGIPIAGQLQLNESDQEPGDWYERAAQRAAKASRKIASRLTQVSEWALWTWACLIGLRLVIDPMWRTMFFESPLAAMGRILLGMP